MGAIFGIVDLKSISADECKKREEVFNTYDFDARHHISHDNVYFSCFQQHVTPESKQEVVPFYDKASGCLITGDIILDNRQALMAQLDVSDIHITDSQLVLKAYLKWGQSYPQYLLGDFVVAIYNDKEKTLLLSRDQLGNKMLYFWREKGKIIFSTLLASFDQKVNKQHIRNFLDCRIIFNNLNMHTTIIEGCKILPPAHSINFDHSKLKYHQYWKLKKKKKTKPFEEGIEEFKEIYSQAVKCRMRTHGEVGVMVSGGLDSSSVACLAAMALKEEGKKLHTYTSVNSSKFDVKAHYRYLIDESNLVKAMKEMHPNMVNNFLDCDKVNSYNIIDEILTITEEPIKYVENSFWLNEIIKTASNDQCKVILDGQNGNTSVSYGNIGKFLYFYLFRLRWVKFIKLFNQYCVKFRVGKKKMLVYLAKQLKPQSRNTSSSFTKYANNSQKERKKLRKTILNLGKSGSMFKSSRASIKASITPLMLNQFSAADTKFGLKYKLVKRDPTKDLRVIECCYQYDINMFHHKGHGRALIREGMRGIVPDSILTNYHVGLQSGDFLHRLECDYGNLEKELRDALGHDSHLEEYVDKEKFLNFLEENSRLAIDSDVTAQVKMRDLISSVYCARYLKHMENKNPTI